MKYLMAVICGCFFLSSCSLWQERKQDELRKRIKNNEVIMLKEFADPNSKYDKDFLKVGNNYPNITFILKIKSVNFVDVSDTEKRLMRSQARNELCTPLYNNILPKIKSGDDDAFSYLARHENITTTFKFVDKLGMEITSLTQPITDCADFGANFKLDDD